MGLHVFRITCTVNLIDALVIGIEKICNARKFLLDLNSIRYLDHIATHYRMSNGVIGYKTFKKHSIEFYTYFNEEILLLKK
jgi:hypothetical protein